MAREWSNTIAGIFDENGDIVGLWAMAPNTANARLISAAPDMLEALKHARQNMPHPDQMIDDAIAKAEGRK